MAKGISLQYFSFIRMAIIKIINNMKKINIVPLIIAICLISFNMSSCSNEKKINAHKDNYVIIPEVEIVDSSICKVLDSVILYEEFCQKNKKHLIRYYDVIKTENIKADFLELTIYSELKFDTIDTKSAILKYNNSLFMFHDLKKIKGLQNILKLSGKTMELSLEGKKVSNIGKTVSVIGVIVENDKISITGKYCYCYHGNLHRMSKFLFIRKLIYDIFCPCRSIKRL